MCGRGSRTKIQQRQHLRTVKRRIQQRRIRREENVPKRSKVSTVLIIAENVSVHYICQHGHPDKSSYSEVMCAKA